MMFSNGTTLLCFVTIFVVTRVLSDSSPVRRFFVNPSCCQKVSNATIRNPIDACFEQKESTFDNCKINAYILITNERPWCVDPRASWLPRRLQQLNRNGKSCRDLMGPEDYALIRSKKL